ncbi:MAG: hypothetical protein JRJ62_00200 [Deltaproteobacteria bacterium]|nr:hypothetical protein [Deltaproteobacteria bacterium]
MTASEKAKKAGLKNLKELAEISGESTQNLNNWFNNYPLRFELILKGAVIKKLEAI